MPVNYYPQKTVAELLELLDSLQKRSTTGAPSFIIAAGMQQQRSFTNSAHVDNAIRRVLFSLYKLDPETYPNPYVERVRRTVANYA